MKLLFDENISYRILKKLSDILPQASHVSSHGLQKTDDIKVREFALKNNFTIVTNDSDFNDLTLIYGFPPKIIWIKTGNISTSNMVALLRNHYQNILQFIKDTENGVLIIE